MSKNKSAAEVAEVAAAGSENEESATRVGPMHQAFADFLNADPYNAGITAEQIFLVTSKRKAFRATEAYREGVKGALAAAKAAEAEAKAAKAEEREQARAAKAAEKEAKAAERKAAAEVKAAEKAAAKEARDAEKAKKAEEAAAAKAAKEAEAAASKATVTKSSTDTAPAETASEDGEPKPRAKSGKAKAAF